VIYDHISGRLSALDRQVVEAVPPGGNWRNLPADFNSERIKQIRQSVANGEGSRSTYYGRLRWDRPAYTISTYFNRPGNGCFIHPIASRLITVREAARLQSFPDAYRFSGNGRSRYIQVGNAVPPLLAFQIAREIPRGPIVDLFAGAGGLSLGFAWAGHEVIAAIDNDPVAIDTLHANVDCSTEAFKADLSDLQAHEAAMRRLAQRAGQAGVHTLIGGPPCQGFSTAGHCRLDDPRNRLVFSFLKAVEVLRPSFVLMENVPALMWRGRRTTLDEICRTMNRLGYQTGAIIAHAEGYGVPQLRRRLFIIGTRQKEFRWPLPWCEILEPAQPKHQPGARSGHQVSDALTTADAISDLPTETTDTPDVPMPYQNAASSRYQRWARGELPLLELLPATVPTFRESLFDLASAR
jgi:DNA (cytosine-5)-methyltransferase 1